MSRGRGNFAIYGGGSAVCRPTEIRPFEHRPNMTQLQREVLDRLVVRSGGWIGHRVKIVPSEFATTRKSLHRALKGLKQRKSGAFVDFDDSPGGRWFDAWLTEVGLRSASKRAQAALALGAEPSLEERWKEDLQQGRYVTMITKAQPQNWRLFANGVPVAGNTVSFTLAGVKPIGNSRP